MENLSVDLLGKSTVKRRKASIKIRKNDIDGYASILLEALKMEYGKKHWGTEIEIIDTLGYKGNDESKVYIKENYIDKGFFLLNSSRAYIRLDRLNNSDVGTIIEFIKDNNITKTEGVLEVLGYDKMVPTIEEQDLILSLCWNLRHNNNKGLTDPRYGLAAACAGWKSSKVESFLKECLKSGDVPLEYVAKKSLEGKYVKLR